MQIKFDQTKTKVLFINEGPVEYKNMMLFPAFLREGFYFYVPAKVHVVYNVVTRLQKAFKKIAIDKDVYEFMHLELKLKTLPEDFNYVTTPLDFQEIALRFMYTVGSGGLLLDAGLGKSKITLDYISLMKFKRTLLICPLALLFVWREECQKHRPDLTIHLVESTNWEKEWELGKDKSIFCLNYSKAAIMEEQIKRQSFDFIHLDEFLIKDPSTVRTKSITAISKNIPYKCGGSGTLINNSVLDMFAPIRYLEPSLVGGNYTNFLNKHTIRNPRDLKQVVGYTKVDEARSVLDSCCIVMHRDEWLKLPAQHFHDIYVNLGDDQREFYRSLQNNTIAQINGRYIEVDNALVMMAKLYQVSNGFVYYSDKPDENEALDLLAEEPTKKSKIPRETIFFDSQPKVDALVKLINGDAKGKRAIIWYNLEAERELIDKALTEGGFKFLTIKGGEKKLGEKISIFNNDPSYSFLIANAKSINYGVTLLGTTVEKLENAKYELFPDISPSIHTQIFYSCNFSLEVYLQQLARNHRIGQTEECHYYRIFANTRIDQKIRQTLDDKMIIRNDMLVDISESLKELGVENLDP